jgi:pimeloyl-ACP methyl ester carboxylesterase
MNHIWYSTESIGGCITNSYIRNIALFLTISTILVSSEIPYPIIFIHGLGSSEETWDTTINHLEMTLGDHNDEHIYHAVLNAYGSMTCIQGQDGVLGTGDDDVLVTFNNEDNVLSDGHIFSLNFKNFWNQDQNNPQLFIHDNDTPGNEESSSNESAIHKQGYALKKCIEAVLYSTEKNKVILVGHSMGGLAIREYLL